MNIAIDSSDVEVEVTLFGGTSYVSVVSADSPFLHQLHSGYAGQQVGAPPTLIQMPVDGGRTACSFMSNAILSIRTSPPVLIQAQMPSQIQVAQPEPPLLSSPSMFVKIQDFLTPEENRQLFAYALENEPHFVPSGVISDETGKRRSKVLFGVNQSRWQPVILERLKIHLPYILFSLNRPTFPVGNVEMQLTASNDGDFFHMHADATPEWKEVSDREITYIYYFHKELRPFSGGGLLMYRTRPDPTNYESIRSVTKVEPENNCLIAFASHQLHELDMVRCPSGKFEDSRFTVNGWLHPKV